VGADAVPSALVDSLVLALLECDTVRDSASRGQIVQQLPAGIRNGIRDASLPRMHVDAIVRRCLNVPGGLAALVDPVGAAEGDSVQFLRVTDIARRLRDHTRPSGEGAG